MTRFSEYSLSTYMLCPRKYFYTYIEKQKRKRVIHVNFVFGGIVHQVCKDFYSFKTEERTKENLHNLFRKTWKANGIKQFFKNIEEERKLGIQGLSMLDNFFSRFYLKTPFRVEEYMEHKVGDYTLFGRIDRIDTNEDGSLSIVDYKTGSYYEESDTKERERKTLQLKLYAFLLQSVKRSVTKGSYYYYSDNVFDDIDFTEESIKYYGKCFDEIISDITFDKKFIKNEGNHCKYCDYKNECLGIKDDDIKLPEIYQNPLIDNIN